MSKLEKPSRKCLVGIDRTTGLVIINNDVPKGSMIRFLRIIADAMESDKAHLIMANDPDLVN